MTKSSILHSSMAKEIQSFPFITTVFRALLALQLIPTVISHDTATSPVASALESWIARNMAEHQERKANIAHGFNRSVLDQLLVKAEDGGVKVIKVKKNGSGDFDTVTAAMDSIPTENMQRVVIWIGGGEYFEKITINRTKNFVTFYGDPMDIPKIGDN